MEKSDLNPGIKVRNKLTGSVGKVYGVNGLEEGPLGFVPWCVCVRTRVKSGKTKGKLTYPIWSVRNLELA